MSDPEPLAPDALRWVCNSDELSFGTTEELEDLDRVPGQDRAVEAIQFAVRMGHPGYNVFALGPPGLHKHRIALEYLHGKASEEPPASDWCYVHDFDAPNKPRALRLPAGRGAELRRDLEHFEVVDVLKASFESESYRGSRQMLEDELKKQHEQAVSEVEDKARRRDIVVRRSPMGFTFSLLHNGQAMQPADFETLPKEDRERIEQDVREVQKDLQAALRRMPDWVKEAHQKLEDLKRETAAQGTAELFDELRSRYSDLPEVLDHIEKIRADVLDNLDELIGEDEPQAPYLARLGGAKESRETLYRANLVVDNSGSTHAPVVYEDNPTYDRVIGRIDRRAEMGALTTDFSLIQAGALHRANGGYLMLDARKILSRPLVYEMLKRALYAREIHLEPPSRALGMLTTMTIEPEPIPLDVKVVLVGQRELYYLLSKLDPEFTQLFRVAADFDERMERSVETQAMYARMIASFVRRDGLRHLDPPGVAAVMEEAVRTAGDTAELSTCFEGLSDLLHESDHWAGQSGHDVVSREHVIHAVSARERRAERIRDRLFEDIRRNTILIDTDGELVGQVNGLAVIDIPNTVFGKPTKITARVRLGRGHVVDIEREVDLGGKLHSKGVLILSGFLGARYAPDRPLSLSASLVIEQSYGAIDGDSASVAELLALLSAVAEVPIKQSVAVTGSVNQHGQVQPVGGVNEKVEAFFDICADRGLTGRQAVLIPSGNARHLMLRPRVIEAVRQGRFRVVPITTVDEGIQALTGLEPGTRGADGKFPDGSFNARVESRLGRLDERRQQTHALSMPDDDRE